MLLCDAAAACASFVNLPMLAASRLALTPFNPLPKRSAARAACWALSGIAAKPATTRPNKSSLLSRAKSSRLTPTAAKLLRKGSLPAAALPIFSLNFSKLSRAF